MTRLSLIGVLLLVLGATLIPSAAFGQRLPAGHITIAQPAEFQYMDPQRTFLSSEVSVHMSIFDSLIRRGPDMRLVPALATAWQAVSPTEWVLTLRRDVKFHNGEPFNAEVVRWNVERITRPGFQDFAFMNPVARAEVVNEFTVKIITKTPVPTFTSLMTMFFIVPPKYMTEQGPEGFTRKPIGSGPFRFVEWVKGSHLIMEANTQYWGDQPEIRAVIWRITPEASVRVAGLRAAEIDLMPQLPPDLFASIGNDPALQALGVRSIRTPFLRFFPTSPQGGGAPLADRRVRQAINHAINVEATIRGLLAGQATRTATLMTPDIFGFDPSVRPYPYDVERARRMLGEAGHPNGFTLNFETWSSGPAPKPVELAQAVAADLERVGVRLRVRAIELGTALNMQNTKQLAPFHLWSWGGAMLDCDDKFWGVFHPGSSATFLTTPDIVKLIEEQRSIVDVRRRQDICARLQRLVAEEALIVPLFAQHDLYGATRRLEWKPRPDERILPWEMKLKPR
jgi:peptide/nickel transport system substrate-binding protein